jgi:hypothetical protein
MKNKSFDSVQVVFHIIVVILKKERFKQDIISLVIFFYILDTNILEIGKNIQKQTRFFLMYSSLDAHHNIQKKFYNI